MDTTALQGNESNGFAVAPATGESKVGIARREGVRHVCPTGRW